MNLHQLLHTINELREPVPFIAVGPGDWESIRDEVIEWGEFSGNPNIMCPHFLVYGIPIMLGGHA